MARTPSTRQLQAEQPPCPQLPPAELEVDSVLAAPSEDPFEPDSDVFESAAPEVEPFEPDSDAFESPAPLLLFLLEPFLKSVAYHPLPRNWNPAAVSCFANVTASHWGH